MQSEASVGYVIDIEIRIWSQETPEFYHFYNTIERLTESRIAWIVKGIWECLGNFIIPQAKLALAKSKRLQKRVSV